MRPESRGSVTLDSADPKAAPRILFNYMAAERDRREMRDAVRLTREIMRQAPMAPYRGAELQPGPNVDTDEAIDAWVRKLGESAYHPSCTCRMGHDDDAVVDGDGRVHRLERLRVVDASIMPRITTGNLNAPTIMMAEKIADAIRGREPLPPSGVGWYQAPDWETTQRWKTDTADRGWMPAPGVARVERLFQHDNPWLPGTPPWSRGIPGAASAEPCPSAQRGSVDSRYR
jgi:choline dehydrogenase